MLVTFSKYITQITLAAFLLASGAEDLHNLVFHNHGVNEIDLSVDRTPRSTISGFVDHNARIHNGCPLHSSILPVATLNVSYTTREMAPPIRQKLSPFVSRFIQKPIARDRRTRAPPTFI